MAPIHAFLVITLRASQIVSGLALTIFAGAVGLSSYLGNDLNLADQPASHTFSAVPARACSTWPVVGPIVFGQNVLVYISWLFLTSNDFTVNDPGDAPDADTGDNICDSDLKTAGEQCTLRAAIQQANALNSAATITFAIPGSGVQKITPASPLPAITVPITLDGTTQNGYAGTPLIQLSGESIGSNAVGLYLSNVSVVRGLDIGNFPGNAISLAGTIGENIIESNYIGTDPVVPAPTPTAVPLRHEFHTRSNAFTQQYHRGNNPASPQSYLGQRPAGVAIMTAPATGNVVAGNSIGSDASGLNALPNGSWGVTIDCTSDPTTLAGHNNTIGGTAARRWEFNLRQHQRERSAGMRRSRWKPGAGNLVGTNSTGASKLNGSVAENGVVLWAFSNATTPGSVNTNTIGGALPPPAM